jgi:excisionase family DNA binding protein
LRIPTRPGVEGSFAFLRLPNGRRKPPSPFGMAPRRGPVSSDPGATLRGVKRSRSRSHHLRLGRFPGSPGRWSGPRKSRRRKCHRGPQTDKDPRDACGISGATESGRLDLNQRPLAPQSCPHCESSVAGSGKSWQSGEVSEEALSVPSPGLVDFRRSFHAPVMQEDITVGADSLLTVKEAAAQLKTSTATVYALCASGRLAYLRISTDAIRIADGDLGRFLRNCAGHR